MKPLWNLNSVVLHGSNRNRLNGMTCSIGPGVTAILGSSGAGKTSLLNLLAGMETPDSGSIEQTFDAVSDGLPLYWAPQGGGLWPHLTVRQHLTELGKDGDFADKLLHEFDLTHRQSAFPAELSQGERARISIARALAVPAQVLLFDEPLVHLDGERKATGWQVTRQAIEESGTHLVLTTHEPETVLREADSVICLADGQLAWEGSVNQLYYQPPNEKVGQFLGPLNWFDAKQQDCWLPSDEQRKQSTCVRPEQLQLESAENGGHTCEVVRSHFMGSYAETTVRRIADNTTRTFVHRPTGSVTTGERVVLRIASDTCNG